MNPIDILQGPWEYQEFWGEVKIYVYEHKISDGDVKELFAYCNGNFYKVWRVVNIQTFKLS